MAPSPVFRHLGLCWLLVPLLGCADDVELLSSSGFGPPHDAVGGTSQPGFAGTAGELGGSASGGDGGGVAGSCAGAGGCAAACRTDAECAYGTELCEGGTCVPCPADAPSCENGWSVARLGRNGCSALQCVPYTACLSTADCAGATCYAGALCLEGCAAGDPSCCFGNLCAQPGCDIANVPLTCTQRGCALGQTCVGPSWTLPDCECNGAGAWQCKTTPPASQCY